MSDSKITTDHDEIRRWVEERGGHPARVKGTGRAGKSGSGLLRIDYPGFSGEDTLEKITWEHFFEQFEKSGLAFIYQDKLETGDTSRFSKLIDRNSTEAKAA